MLLSLLFNTSLTVRKQKKMEEKLKAFIFERKKQHCLYLQTTFPGENPKESSHRKLQALINGFRTTELDQYTKITCVVLHT